MAKYSNETKAAVIAALLEGQSQSFVSQEYNVPRSTIQGWKRAYDERGAENSVTKKDVGTLILEYLETNLATLKAQAEFFKDESWLRKQDAASVATLHGVMTDKSVRLLEAMERNADSN
ncbi:MAG TPA: helix-turn-helix domain-containing protein [Anaerolineaceae bacterium]|nr:helix-turn-helix domain-containing protein [Anaerolineaceae bacterium]